MMTNVNYNYDDQYYFKDRSTGKTVSFWAKTSYWKQFQAWG